MRAWIVIGSLAVVSCAHGGAAAPVEEDFRAFECPADEAGRARALGAALKLAFEVDYLEVLIHGGGGGPLIVGERGAPCASASDAAACRAELARQKEAWIAAHPDCDDCRVMDVVFTTRGDDVVTWSEPEQLLTLLGPIDSPADAWLLMMVRSGYLPHRCGDAAHSGYRESVEGYELRRLEWVSTCEPIERVEIVELFRRDGSVAPVRRSVVEHEPEGCYVPRPIRVMP